MFGAEQLSGLLDQIETGLFGLDPACVSGAEARSMVELCARGERLLGAGTSRFAVRVQATGAFVGAGHKDAADWMGSVTGLQRTKARGRLEAAQSLSGATPEVAEAFARGKLSADQAEVIAPVAELDDAGGTQLLQMATSGQPLSAVKQKAEALAAGGRDAESEAARDARQHAQRSVHTWRGKDGGLHGRFFLGDKDAALFLARLEPRAHELARQARRSGAQGSFENWRADSLVTLVTGAQRSGLDGSEVRAFVRVDAAALKRGTTQGDELCQVDGLGAVSVATAQSLMELGIYEVMVADCQDVYAISKPKRDVTARQHSALAFRDPNCVIPQCTIAHGLEEHHWQQPVIKHGKAELINLARVCKVHHHMLTHEGCRLADGPQKGWRFVDPRKPEPEPAEHDGVPTGTVAFSKPTGQPPEPAGGARAPTRRRSA